MARRAVPTRALGMLAPLLATLATWLLAAPTQAADPVGLDQVRVLPLGDSITLGVSDGMPRRASPGGYRSPLDSLLQKARIPHVFVGTMTINPSPTLMARGDTHHEGHNRYRVDQVSADLNGVANGPSDNGGHWLTGSSEHTPIYPDVV